MKNNLSTFGEMPCGESAYRIEIAAGGLSAAIITYGAAVQELRLMGFDRSLVLGLNTLEDYIVHSPHFGAIAGRVANRIAYGKFSIDGVSYQADQNIDGTHTLHGGAEGFGVRNWQIEDLGSDFVTLRLESGDGDMGFPGNMIARCRYSITEDQGLRVELSAESDAPTLCNLAHHSYFNLDGEGDILGHEIMIDAGEITEMSDALLPTGNLLDVGGTMFDLRELRQVSIGKADGSLRYDHNYCLSRARVPLRRVAKVRGAGIEMDVLTTEPGLQFYDAAKLATPVSGIDGRTYGANSGLCLEAQFWPDAPNHENFPDITLRPGETYRQITEYRFSR